MATYSSVLAWRIPGMREPGGLPSMGSHRVGHDWGDLAAADSILKSRDFTLPTKVHLVKAIGEDNGTPFQYSCLENPINGAAWWATVHGVSKSRTQLSDFTLTFHFHALEEEMATHSSVLALRIPGMGEPGGLLSMGLHRVRHDWNDLAEQQWRLWFF